MELVKQGKVRDVYRDGNDVILVASDRVSVYDVILPTEIPEKGIILTQLSLWFFRQLADIIPNHVISEDVPEDWRGRAIRCTALDIVPIECIARGYLAGSGWEAYQADGQICGISLPAGLAESEQLPEPIFTPSTKAELGSHDELISIPKLHQQIGESLGDRLRELTLAIFQRGSQIALDRGVIIADTKLEFGRTASGDLILADEVLTPDSSRFWAVEDYRPGRAQQSLDKQFVRDWARSVPGWQKTEPGPELPAAVVAETRRRYINIYERLTGSNWA